MRFIWDDEDWPELTWRTDELLGILSCVWSEHGRLMGRMEALGLEVQQETTLRALTEDAVTTSKIEGEQLARAEVRSSVARRLDLSADGLQPSSRDVDGIVEVTADAIVEHEAPLTLDRILSWHAALFPSGRSGLCPISPGALRTGPVEVVSGAIGRERVHFEGPLADRLRVELDGFLEWFESDSDTDAFLKAGLAHFWFVTLHPFEDGNGRLARAVADLALARASTSTKRFYSMSNQILAERNDYYAILERTQKGSVDITDWQLWFLECLSRAIHGSGNVDSGVIDREQFWTGVRELAMNERQIAMLKSLLEGFEGKLTSSKWAKMMKVSQDTAHRDITDLVSGGVLKKDPGGGRSTSYSLADRSSGQKSAARGVFQANASALTLDDPSN